jgi:NADH dehydrogenase [ubiquinone] 1 alpha subcomplex assembly factor 7
MSAQAKSKDDLGTPLAARLKARIVREGPISVQDYMEACLADARHGYYLTRQPIGREGDFVTAPEISQVFGELLGAWAAAAWQNMGAPQRVVLAELGPGRGTLMADALRVCKTVPKLLDGATIALIETSPVLRDVQRATFKDAPARLQWFERLEDAPQDPLIVIANEFLDALPVRQFVRAGGVWRERMIGIDPDGALAFHEGAPVGAHELPAPLRAPEADEGAIAEIRPAAAPLLETLAARAKVAPVAALIIDYGHAESGLGDTLQAVRGHKFANPLDAPGEADLTAHVDFAALKEAARTLGLAAYGPMPQGEFLLRLGLAARLERLLRDATEAQKQTLLSGAARLADPRQMGVLFKALALQSSGLAPPPPFGEI